MYSCYAAKKVGCKVYSFEPSVFNLELLARNIHLNSLSEKITIVPIPLSDVTSFKNFFMTTKEWGGAFSNFGESTDHHGKPISNNFYYKTLGISIDQAVNQINFEKPNYIKMDVDGIEHLIINGANKAIKNVESILIEVNDDYIKQSKEVNEHLNSLGFRLKEKKHSEIIEQSSKFSSFYNQIWVRDN